MTTKLVWPATFLASFALAAACGGGSTDSDGTGGEGGEDGSGGSDTISSGGSTGGQNLGGGAGEGGQGGGGPVIIVPLTCSDGEQNESETDVDCGGPDCDPCDDDAVCVEPTDCDSGVCTDGVCIAPDCGDRVTNGDEDCDPGRETDDCNEDCTFTVCGDGYVNEQAEDCERDGDLGPWQRCGHKCRYGVDLDGTWRTNSLPDSESPWELLPTGGSQYRFMPTFHYEGEASIVNHYAAQRFDIAANTWVPLTADPGQPSLIAYNDGASDGEGFWIVLGTTMYRYDLATEVWAAHTPAVPDTTGVTGSAVVHDGQGFLWYVGSDPAFNEGAGENVLVRFDPGDGSFQSFSWQADVPGYPACEDRLAYDPIRNTITFGAFYYANTFVTFDLESETFVQGAELPDGGMISDAACQDRAGGMYVVSDGGTAYRYDIGADTYEPLPELPAPHDSNSSCTVSESGYLYYGTSSSNVFARLRLNRR